MPILSLVLIEILIFGTLVFLLREVLMRPIRKLTSHLEKLNEEYTRKIEEAKIKKEEAERYYQGTLAKTREETERLKQQLIQEGQEAARQTIAEARQQGQEIIRRAQSSSEMLIQEIEKKIQAEGLRKAREWLLQLLPGTMSEETHSHWVDAFLESGFEGLNRFQVVDKVQEAEVMTAFPLKAAQKKKLEAQIGQALGKTVPIHEKVDPELILGLRLTMNSLVVDGSFQSKIIEALRHADSE